VATIISDIQMPNVTEEVPVDPDTLHQLKYKVTNSFLVCIRSSNGSCHSWENEWFGVL